MSLPSAKNWQPRDYSHQVIMSLSRGNRAGRTISYAEYEREELAGCLNHLRSMPATHRVEREYEIRAAWAIRKRLIAAGEYRRKLTSHASRGTGR